MLVNGKVLLTRDQVNMLALGETLLDNSQHWWDVSVSSLLNQAHPVVVVEENAPPVDLGDGWVAVARWDHIYAWNEKVIKAGMERSLRESTAYRMSDAARDYASVGLFQQRPAKHFWRGLIP